MKPNGVCNSLLATRSHTNIAEEAASLTASTTHGITKVLYEYVPSLSLLASVKIVEDTEKNSKRTQLVSFCGPNEGKDSLVPCG